MGWGYDSDDYGDFHQCRGLTAKGPRCKLAVMSQYCAHTIAQYGYCSKHMSQRAGQDPDYHTQHGSYRGDKYHPEIVEAARRGDLAAVKRILKIAPGKIDEFRRRREVEEKWGYDKEWTWDDDTALVAAAREGHLEVVAELVARGANINHKSCPTDDVHQTAITAAAASAQPPRSSCGHCKPGMYPTKCGARAALQKQARLHSISKMLAAAPELPPLQPAAAASAVGLTEAALSKKLVKELKKTLSDR